jgi:GxxExxY protein
MGCGYRVDFLVEGFIIVEVKSVERFEPVHLAQVISYLRLSGCTLGLLFNFNVKWLVGQGFKRVVYGFPG